VYAGIISFAGAATDLTGGLVRLDQAGRRTLVSSLDSSYSISSQAGTALFYAVHKALASLKSGDDRYPDDLDSVNVITFTDGLDNASTGMSALTPLEGQTFDTDTDYTTYLGGEIAGRTIAGKPVTAYSVGVRGSDVSDTTKFNSDLAGIAGAGKSQTLTNFEDLQTAFQGIADGLQITSTSSTSFTMKTTLLATNIRVRMTFDVTDMTGEAAAASAKYIEGVITRTGAGESLAYSFGGISYTGGLGSVEGAGPISGVRNNNEVSFTFTGVQGYNPSTDGSKVKQWTRASDEAPWQVNSEYSVAGATETEVEALSSVIYLVLDSSTSLNTMQIGQIRSAAEAFINSLYSQLNGLVPSGVSAVAQSSSSVKVSWNPVSGGVYDAESYSIYRSTSSDGPYVYSYSTASPSWLDTGRSSGMTYYYKVSANFRQWLNGGGYNYWSGAQSSCASVTTP
jgi:hypothetical protein